MAVLYFLFRVWWMGRRHTAREHMNKYTKGCCRCVTDESNHTTSKANRVVYTNTSPDGLAIDLWLPAEGTRIAVIRIKIKTVILIFLVITILELQQY